MYKNIYNKYTIMSFVYLLMSSNGATYIGATVDLNRRLDQHNKLLKGGAKATGIRVENGEMWVRMAHVKNFPDWQSALQFEWRWKQLSRKIYKNGQNPLQRRVEALKLLLSLEKSTIKAKPFCEWENPPEVVSEDSEFLRELDVLL
jgi:predicted GIY-YIG superfamily endonuclease